MEATRREFLERLGASAAMLGVFPLALDGFPSALTANTTAEEWDLSWTTKVTGKHRAIFDVPEVDSGYGVWRATIWGAQYQDVLKASPKDISTVLVMRHNGIALAMQQAYWDKYGIGKEKKVTHPVTQQSTDRNPALLSSARNEQPADFDAMALDKFIARGGIALGCALAFKECIGTVQAKDGVSEEEAKKRAMSYLVPGVALQPSGVFAVIRAQQAGCVYIRAS